MHKIIFIFFFILVLQSCNQTNTKFANGQLFEWKDSTTVYFFLNSECPLCNRFKGRFLYYQKQFPNTTFYYVFYGESSVNNGLNFLKSDSISTSQIILDTDKEIFSKLKPIVTPQVIVTKNNTIQYSGLLDDRFTELGVIQTKITIDYLSNALNSLLNNETVKIAQTKPAGCYIEP